MGKILPLYVKEAASEYGVENAHDKLFKSLLDDVEELKLFITEFVGINIRNESIEKCNNEYITKQYKMYKADMVYKIKEKELYFLIEHQSSVDKKMPSRMLNYYMEEINEVSSKRKSNKVPIIVPIVLYTGEEKWKVEKLYSEIVEKEKIIHKRYVELEYELIDINKYNEQELLAKKTALAYAMLIEKNRGKESLVEVLEKISNVCNTNKNKEKMQQIINYILYPILEEDTEKMLKEFKIEEEFSMKTAQDYIREEIRELKLKAQIEGREKGIAEGRVEGKAEEQRHIIINMIKNRVKIEEIKKYTGLKEEEIEKIAANM